MTACRICLEPGDPADGFHPACCQDLFGTDRPPRIDLDPDHLQEAGWRMAGHTSISGMQPKISLRLSHDRAALQVAPTGGTHILKPQSPSYPSLPENEHLTMRLASAFGIPVPPLALVSLAGGATAYLIRRYDRDPVTHRKFSQEDFCQLAGKQADDKDQGSAELCARLLRQHIAAEDLPVQLRSLFRRFLFAFLCGNGDLHLKNLALLITGDGRPRLSPAYDLLCTRLVIPDDQLTLPICGKRDRLKRATWLEFGAYCDIAANEAAQLLDDCRPFGAQAQVLIARSFLPAAQKDDYAALWVSRLDSLRV